MHCSGTKQIGEKETWGEVRGRRGRELRDEEQRDKGRGGRKREKITKERKGRSGRPEGDKKVRMVRKKWEGMRRGWERGTLNRI